MLAYVVLGLLCSFQAATAAPVILSDASQFCITCIGRIVQKPLFVNPNNCHQYYNCFFYNSTYADGILQNCPQGTFFNDNIQTCVPEGSVACTDRCQDDAVETIGYYAAANSCNAFYYCSRGISYQFCCPFGTSFDSTTGGCIENPGCNDVCNLPQPIPTATAAPQQLGNGKCVDSYGVTLGTVSINNVIDNTVFAQFDTDGSALVRKCALGSLFSLALCRCDDSYTVAASNNYRQALLYLPFDANYDDYSVTKLSTSGENVAIDQTNSAQGGGSLLVNANGLVRIYGSPGIDYGTEISILLFYQTGGASSSSTGGLIANSKTTGSNEFAFDVSSLGNNTVIATFSLVNPVGQVSIQIKVTNQNQWNQVGAVLDTKAGTLTSYVNGQQQSQVTGVRGRINWGHCAAYVGTDFGPYGTLAGGHIDEVLISKQAFTAAEVQAHNSGQAALKAAGLIP